MEGPPYVREISSRSASTLPFYARALIRLAQRAIRKWTMRQDGQKINRTVWDVLDMNVDLAHQGRGYGGVDSLDVQIDAEKGVGARVYVPPLYAKERLLPVIFYFHGGGFATMRPCSAPYDRHCRELCKQGRVVVSVDYRRSPEYRFPAAYIDCFSALLWLRSQVLGDKGCVLKSSTLVTPLVNSSGCEGVKLTLVNGATSTLVHPNSTSSTLTSPNLDFGYTSTLVRGVLGYTNSSMVKVNGVPLAYYCDLSRCFLMGDSAGGNIVHHVNAMAAASAELVRPIQIVGCIQMFPFFGGEKRSPSELSPANQTLLDLPTCDWFWKAFLPLNASRDHPCCNVLGSDYPSSSSHMSGLQNPPPCLVAVADHDLLKDRQLLYAHALQQAGGHVQLHVYPGAIHCFHLLQKRISLTAQLYAHVESFIQARSASGRPL